MLQQHSVQHELFLTESNTNKHGVHKDHCFSWFFPITVQHLWHSGTKCEL